MELMRRLELVDYEPGSDSGNMRYYPKGRLVKSLLETLVLEKAADMGAMEVETPIMYDMEHPTLKKYLDRFPARQYQIDSDKRKLFGYVEQSFRKVPGTVGEQITLSDPGIDRDAMERAAKLVELDEYISSLPRGYDTPFSETLFSQGQLQLLSIARAVAADPEILLLDEITANLDSGTEEAVTAALDRASENRTVLAISHRLNTETERGRLVRI